MTTILVLINLAVFLGLIVLIARQKGLSLSTQILIGLIVGVVHSGASLLVFGLMIVFTAAVGTALARGLDISCGCFDTEGGTQVGLAKIAENVALTAAAFWVWRGDRSFLSLGRKR